MRDRQRPKQDIYLRDVNVTSFLILVNRVPAGTIAQQAALRGFGTRNGAVFMLQPKTPQDALFERPALIAEMSERD